MLAFRADDGCHLLAACYHLSALAAYFLFSPWKSLMKYQRICPRNGIQRAVSNSPHVDMAVVDNKLVKPTTPKATAAQSNASAV